MNESGSEPKLVQWAIIREIVEARIPFRPLEDTWESRNLSDLGLDSMHMVGIILDVEEKLGVVINVQDLDEVPIKDARDLVNGLLIAASKTA